MPKTARLVGLVQLVKRARVPPDWRRQPALARYHAISNGATPKASETGATGAAVSGKRRVSIRCLQPGVRAEPPSLSSIEVSSVFEPVHHGRIPPATRRAGFPRWSAPLGGRCVEGGTLGRQAAMPPTCARRWACAVRIYCQLRRGKRHLYLYFTALRPRRRHEPVRRARCWR